MGNVKRCSFLLSFDLLFLSFVISAISAKYIPLVPEQVPLVSEYVPSDNILLNCGHSGVAIDFNNRTWIADTESKLATMTGTSTTAWNLEPGLLIDITPFEHARFFKSEFNYSITVSEPGWKFLRLYFYTVDYLSFPLSDAHFSVSLFAGSGSFTLLKDFDAAANRGPACLILEYSIYVRSETVDLTFIPSPIRNAHAFINGIEVFSHPDIYSTADGTTTLVGQGTPIIIDDNTALENIGRYNVGDSRASVTEDSGLYRYWATYYAAGGYGVAVDYRYYDTNVTYSPSLPTYIAPIYVYQTARSMGPDFGFNLKYNLTWTFSVDSGFYYFIRLHFCELLSKVNKVNERVFNIFINNQTAESGADVIAWTGKPGIPVYKDYVVLVPNSPSPQQDLWLAMSPDASSKSKYNDTILNAIEIFKISDFNGNLAGRNPERLPKSPESTRKSSKKYRIDP